MEMIQEELTKAINHFQQNGFVSFIVVEETDPKSGDKFFLTSSVLLVGFCRHFYPFIDVRLPEGF